MTLIMRGSNFCLDLDLIFVYSQIIEKHDMEFNKDKRCNSKIEIEIAFKLNYVQFSFSLKLFIVTTT